MRARIQLSDAPIQQDAADQVATRLAAESGAACDLALVFVSTAHGALDLASAADLGARLGARRTAVAQVEGLLAEDVEWVNRPALAALALSGDIAAHSVDHVRGREAEVGDELAASLGPLGPNDLVLAIADAHDFDAQAFAGGMRSCAPASVLGVGVEGAGGFHATHALDGEITTGGVLGLRLRATQTLKCAIAPGVQLREVRRVDEARGNWLHALSGASALEEFRDAAGVLWNDEHRARRSVFVALPDGDDSGEPHAALARAVVGIDEEAGAIALADSVVPGSRIAFALRDGDAARGALSSAARSLGGIAPRGTGVGFAASCPSRGAALFGHPGMEAAYLASAFGFAAWVGLLGSFQVGGTPGSPASLLTGAGALVRAV